MSSQVTTTNPFLAALEAEGSSLLSAGETAWAAAKAELETLGTEALGKIGTAISTAIADLEDGESIEDIETAVLNLLEQDVATLLSGLTSGGLQALIAFASATL